MAVIRQDLHNNVAVVRVLDPAAAGAAGTGRTSQAIDRRGYGALEFVIAYGSLASGAAASVRVLESDTVSGTFTSVVDDDLLGTEAAAGLAAGARTSGVNHLCVKKIGYKGYSRYVKLAVIPTVSGVPVAGAVAVLGAPSIIPTT
jgi:hypothetical protein